MKTNLLKQIMVFAILILTSLNVKAQITVGSAAMPERAMLLELKTQEATSADNQTVGVNGKGGGLGLPRVNLIDKATLEPFISKNDADWKSNKDNLKEKHAGMMVYNLNTTSGDFQQGIYAWDGAQWNKIQDNKDAGNERYFYLPSCNIKLEKENVEETFDIYLVYTQFARATATSTNDCFVSSSKNTVTHIPSNKSGRIYNADELEYVVTYYDKRIMYDLKIEDDGKLKYKVKDLNLLDKNSYINIVLVVK
jgi:hypothetical protein